MRKLLSIILAALFVLPLPGAAVAKQDVLVELFYSSAWHDHTDRVLTGEQITINHGAGNEQSGVIPSDASLTFLNNDGEMNPDNRKSSLYGLIGHNTPIRITIGGDIRFSGQVVSWKPRRALGEVSAARGKAWVDVQAQGTIRRLGQGTPPVESALRRTVRASSPAHTWPMEDAAGADRFASGLPSGNPLLPDGTPTFAAFDKAPGSKPFVKFVADGALTNPTFQTVTIDGAAGYIAISFVLQATKVDELNPGWDPVTVRLSGSTVFADVLWATVLGRWNSGVHDELGMTWGNNPDNAAIAFDPFDDQPHAVQLVAEQDGADIIYEIWLDGELVDSATHAGETLGTPVALDGPRGRDIAWGGFGTTDNTGSTLGLAHLTIHNQAGLLDGSDFHQAAIGFLAETAGARFTRLCAELGITSTIVGTSAETQPMGPQYPDTDLGLLEEVAKTDAGIIHDTRSALGLTLRTGRSLYNQG